MNESLFARIDERLGEFSIRAVDPATDTAMLHGWLVHPKSVFWMMQGATLGEVQSVVRGGLLGVHRGHPAFLLERYDPADSELAAAYPVRPGDVGMHFLVAPADESVHGFTRSVIVTIMGFLFSDPATRRVVVEPDIRNHRVHTLNAAVGFVVLDTVPLRGKSAYLSACTREQFTAAVCR